LAYIPTGLTQVAGPVSVTVKNPGGVSSTPLTFDVPPPRTILSATPNVLLAATAGSLLLNGTNFEVQDRFNLLSVGLHQFDGPVERLSSTQVRSTYPASAVLSVNTYQTWLTYSAPAANKLGLYASMPLNIDVAPSGTCRYDLVPDSATLPATASSGSVSLITTPGCAWTATSPTPAITFSSPTSGSGPTVINFNVAANNATQALSASLTIGSKLFNVTQAGIVCQFGLTASATAALASGLSGTVAIGVSNSLCAWSASSSAPWLRITSAPTGSGNSTLSFVADPNPAPAGRSATITANGQTIAFTQAGSAPCTFTLSQSTQPLSSASSTFTVEVTSPAGCSWTATSPVPWITIPSGAAASGKGTVSLSAAANPTAAARSASLSIAGQPFVVTQVGSAATAACAFTSTPSLAAAEGRTELLGDLVLTCAALPAGLVGDLELTLNSNVTNGADLPSLTINSGPAITAQISGYNNVRWPAVRPPAGAVILRIANLRADASLVNATANLASTVLTASLRFNANIPIPIANPVLTAALVLPGLSAQPGVPQPAPAPCPSSTGKASPPPSA